MSKKRAELEARFKQLDRNKDGVVTLEEMRKELRDQGYPEGLAQKFMSQFDVDGNGSITMEEFVNTLSRTDNVLQLFILGKLIDQNIASNSRELKTIVKHFRKDNKFLLVMPMAASSHGEVIRDCMKWTYNAVKGNLSHQTLYLLTFCKVAIP
ncbi:unnamed protein product [Trichobilharzia szidati]|nr:unnamed protein product [Trichobilharzia szidati]